GRPFINCFNVRFFTVFISLSSYVGPRSTSYPSSASFHRLTRRSVTTFSYPTTCPMSGRSLHSSFTSSSVIVNHFVRFVFAICIAPFLFSPYTHFFPFVIVSFPFRAKKNPFV